MNHYNAPDAPVSMPVPGNGANTPANTGKPANDIRLSPFYHSAVNAVTKPDNAMEITPAFFEWKKTVNNTAALVVLFLRRHKDGEAVHINRLAEGVGVSDDTIYRLLKRTNGLNGMIDVTDGLPYEDAGRILMQKTPQGFTHNVPGLRKCAWCRGKTLILHAHHYPVQKQHGGAETVDICPNCHTEFHSLIRDGFILCLTEKADVMFAEVAK